MATKREVQTEVEDCSTLRDLSAMAKRQAEVAANIGKALLDPCSGGVEKTEHRDDNAVMHTQLLCAVVAFLAHHSETLEEIRDLLEDVRDHTGDNVAATDALGKTLDALLDRADADAA